MRLHLRLFLEGVEVPVVAANIQAQKNNAAVCSIQLPANDYLMDLKPRTLVHLFCYDAYQGAPPEEQVYVGGGGIDLKQKLLVDPAAGSLIPPPIGQGPTAEQSFVDLLNDNYKLSFGGEVMGIQYSKTPSSRCIVLQCADWSSYWDIAYQYQVSGFSLGGGGIKAAFTGASTTVFNDFLEGSGDIVVKLMQTPPRSYPALKGTLLGAMVHLMEAIGGCYFGKRAVRGTNDFFSLAEMRLHLTQMIGANPFTAQDELRLMSANGFGSLFSKALGGLGKQVTIRNVMMALQRYIFHEIVPITSPRYIPAQNDPNSPQQELIPLSADPETSPLAKAAASLKTRVLELKSRQEASTTLVAAKTQSNTRGGLQKELKELAKVAVDAQAKAKRVGTKTGDWAPLADFFGISDVVKAFESASRQFVAVLEATRISTSGGYNFHLAGTTGAATVLQILEAINEGMQKVFDAKHRKRVQRSTSQPDPPQRLLAQVYRPDVWMVAPPRCNVIFPEQYSQFSYGRNFQAEVTRMLLRTHSAFFGSDILFDGFYMAPSRILGARTGKKIGKGRVGIDPPDLADAPAWIVKDMMDHELYTGIIPAFERMSDLNLHAIRGGSIEINGAKVGYAQLACNHIFFQHRFKSRELMLSGKFNPYAVLGFPMLVIDKYLGDDQLRAGEYDTAVAARLADAFKDTSGTPLPSGEQSNIVEVSASGVDQLTADLLAARPNTHYLGTPEVISHSISASAGGTTQFQMGYARTTNEKSEFLGDNVGRSATAKRKKNVQIATVVAALEPPRVGTRGFLNGEIKECKEVTDQYQKKQAKKIGSGKKTAGAAILGTAGAGARFASSTLLPLYVSENGFSGRKRRGTKVPVGIEQPAAAYGSEVVALVGSGGTSVGASGEVLVTFRAFRMVEEVGAYATQEVELPPEELTFPPWYGENYRTNKIGGLYSYFFGVGAITDPTIILGGAAPRKFGSDGEGRSLYIEFENSFSRVAALAGQGAVARDDQMPIPGLSSTPEAPGGGSIGPAGQKNPMDSVLGGVKARSSIGLAVEELVRAYSAVRREQYDTPQFVQNYTWRPIASMVDMFGSSDLNISDQGFVVAGREGFHSRAFGDFDDLRQLVGPDAAGIMPQKILGLNVAPKEIGADDSEKDARVSARLDTRKEKRLAVYRYLYALSASRGVILG
jgi:hypothetical protein